MRKCVYTISENKDGYKLPSNVRGQVNSLLEKNFGKGYHATIPLKDIFNVLKKYRLVAVQEDNTPWSGFLTGKEGKTTLDISYSDPISGELIPVSNSVLWLSWYKMQSGNYEVVCYLS